MLKAVLELNQSLLIIMAQIFITEVCSFDFVLDSSTYITLSSTPTITDSMAILVPLRWPHHGCSYRLAF